MSGALRRSQKAATAATQRPAACKIALNHATVREQMGMVEFVEACAKRGIFTASVWEDEIEKIGAARARQALAEAACSVFGFNRAGPLLAESRAGREALLAAAKRLIDKARAFAADHVLIFPGGLPAGSQDLMGAREQAEDAVAELLAHARDCGIKLAIEPLHPMLAGDRTCVVTLSHANDICDRLGTGLGLVIDVYHVWWDERLEAEVARAGRNDRIFGFQVNDWLVPTRHILRDRGMMGDGIIDLRYIWRLVCAAGYEGPVEVEIFSDDWWSRDGEGVLDTAIARCGNIFMSPPESR